MEKGKNILKRFLEIPEIVEETKALYEQYDTMVDRINRNINRLQSLADPEFTDAEREELKALEDELDVEKNLTTLERAIFNLAWVCGGALYRYEMETHGHTDENFRRACIEEYRKISGISDILDSDLLPIRPIPRRF